MLKDFLKTEMLSHGMHIKEQWTTQEVILQPNGLKTVVNKTNGEKIEDVDCVLSAIGRQPNVEDIGLEALGVKKTEKGYIEVEKKFR